MQPIFGFPYSHFMFAMYDQRFRDILLLILGFFGAIWFFFDLGNHHPLSSLDIQLTSEESISRADSILTDWQYQPFRLKKKSSINSYSDLVDNLQLKYGREKFLEEINSLESEKKLPLYFWDVQEFLTIDGENKNYASFKVSKQGEVISFDAGDPLINEQTPFNRMAIRSVLGESFARGIKEDSVISALVDLQHFRNPSMNVFRQILSNPETSYQNYNWGLADFYLKQTYWSHFSFKRDSLSLNDDENVRYARAFYTSQDTIMGIVPKLEFQVMPAGALRSINVTLGNNIKEVPRRSEVRNTIMLGFLFFLGVWMLVSFYLRIKVRTIDTRPALVVAVVGGFLIPLLLALETARNYGVEFESGVLTVIMEMIFSSGVIGALFATTFFVVTAISDSVTRQYWPEKLRTWDLVRRGMFKNKPIGWAMVRAVSIGAIMAGLFTILMSLMPSVTIGGEVLFLQGRFVLSPLANLIITLLLGVLVVAVIFLILGTQLYKISNKKWLLPIMSGVLFALFDPFLQSMFPESSVVLMNFVLGFIIGVFYVEFDFVTVALGFFIFLNFLTTSKGWVVSNSPDAQVFYVFMFTMILMMLIALYFVIVGDEKDKLPDYVPDYIEDLAKEQRVQQELDIARTVQKTFLPNTTPNIKGFDTAAICEPAQETGGDYYDIIKLDDSRTAIAIGDVSGKGIQAAFYMTFAKGVIHSLSSIFPSPKMMLFRANKLFNENATRGTFISMIYGVLNSDENTFTYIRAGHNPMLYKKAGGEINWLQPKGVAIGMVKGDSFNKVVEEETIQLSKGDVLVLYTDGITEAQDEEEKFYGEERLKKLIKREKTDSAKELRNLIIEDVRTFTGDALQYDDMTLVVIKV